MYIMTARKLKRKVTSMQAYEFYAKPKNGFIPIPEQYKNQITDNIFVIVLEKPPTIFNREEANARKKTDMLSPPSLNTKGWKFNREEANGR
jgi:adenylate kinase